MFHSSAWHVFNLINPCSRFKIQSLTNELQDEKQMAEKERKELEWQVVMHALLSYTLLSDYNLITFTMRV